MATKSNRDVILGIGIETSGEADVQRLAAEVRKLAREGDPAAAEFRALADQIDRLGEQVGAVQVVRNLNDDIDRLAASQREAAAATKVAKDALEAQSASAAELGERQRAAAAAVVDGTVKLKEAQGAVKTLGANTDAATKKTEDYRTELTRLQAAVTAASVDLIRLKDAKAQASVAAAKAATEETKLAAAYERTRTAAGAVDAAVRERAASLKAAETAAAGLAVSTTDLAQAETQLLTTQARLIAQRDLLLAQDNERKALDAQNNAALERTNQNVRALASAYELEQAAIAESAAAAAAAAAEKQRLADATEKTAAAERAAAAAIEAANAKRREQREFDEQAAVAAYRLAEARKAAQAAAQSELLALKDSEEFTRRYAQAQRDAAAAVEREGVEAMRLLEQASRAADKAQEQLVASLRETEAAAEKYAAAIGEAAAAGEQDVAAANKRRAAAEALIASERELTAEQREAATVRDRNRGLLIAEAQALLASARAADESRAATARLVQQTIALGTSVDKSSASIRQMGTITEQAFGQVGVRGLQAIEAEVRRVDMAMSQLARDLQAGRISTQDFDRAVGSATVKLAALNREALQVNALPSQFERINTSIQGVISRFGALGAAVATVGVAVRPVIESTIALDQMRRTLTTVTGSADEAARQIDFLRKVSQQSGQQFDEVGKSYAKFAASALQSGLSIQQTQEVFKSVALAAGNLGLSSDQAKRALEALSQIASKGTVSMEELRQQLGDALPGVLPLLAKELGLTQAELNKVVEAGNLLAQEAIPAIGRALGALQPQDGVVNGMVATWNRFINVVRQAGTTLTEGPLGGAIGVGLKGLAEGIKAVAFVAVSASEGIAFLAKTIGATTAFVAGGGKNFDEYRETISRFAQESADGIGKFAETARGASEASAGLMAETAKLGGSFAKLALESQKTIDTAVLQSQASDKIVEARKKEIETSGALASIAGDEAAAREQAAAATLRGAEAGEAAARADLAVVAALQAAKTAVLEKAAAEGLGAEATKKAVEELDKKLIKAEADVEKSRAQADALRAGAIAADLAAKAARNNADRIGEMRKAYEDAVTALENVKVALISGAATEDDVKKATEALATAKGLLRDAIDDVTEALDRQIKAMQADIKLQEAGIKLEIERQKNAVISANLANNEYAARQASLKIKELELRLGNLSVEQKRAEAEMTLKALDIEEKELRASGQLTTAKALEIEARRKTQLAAVLESQAANEAAKSKRVEYEELQKGTPAREAHSKATGEGTTATKDNTNATNSNSSALDRNASGARSAAGAVDALTAARQRYNQTLRESQQYGSGVTDGSGLGGITDPNLTNLRQPGQPDSKTDKNAPYMGDPDKGIPPDPYGRSLNQIEALQKQGAAVDNSGMFALLAKYEKGQITGSDLPALQSALAAARQNTYNVANSSLGNLRAGEYAGYEAKLAAAVQSAQYKALAPAGGGAFGGYSTPATRAAASKTVNVNLSLGGKTTSLTSSQAEADKLLKMIEDAQRASGTGP